MGILLDECEHAWHVVGRDVVEIYYRQTCVLHDVALLLAATEADGHSKAGEQVFALAGALGVAHGEEVPMLLGKVTYRRVVGNQTHDLAECRALGLTIGVAAEVVDLHSVYI